MTMNRSVPFKLQHDQNDCGVACLRNVLSYYKAEISLEKLREWSGTGSQGTTLLGLYQAASQAGFKASGAQAAGIGDLRKLSSPCILHVNPDETLMHFVVCYPSPEGPLLIGDPAK